MNGKYLNDFELIQFHYNKINLKNSLECQIMHFLGKIGNIEAEILNAMLHSIKNYDKRIETTSIISGTGV